ncbi:MAG: hypothetical protein WHV66_09650 [Anaerolineales bacterium]
MDTMLSPLLSQKNRLGFHYYPDTLHYRDTDLTFWLPELAALGASWLVVKAPVDRAIPESFIRGLIQADIAPILQFDLPLSKPTPSIELEPLFLAYARWGVRAILLFDRPNSHRAWPLHFWAQEDLNNRFLERFIPLANMALHAGLIPIFPALEPGGGYWDTAFLRSALESLAQRNESAILKNLVLAARPWLHNHGLNWGSGGPDRWPDARPYSLSQDGEDQRGFRIFDWYLAITRAVLGKSCPVILLETGVSTDPISKQFSPQPVEDQTQTVMTIARLLNNENVSDPADSGRSLAPLPAEVISANFWLLAADTYSPYQSAAWYKVDGSRLPVVEKWVEWVKEVQVQVDKSSQPKTPPVSGGNGSDVMHPIQHYLLLPSYEWGVADWHLEVIRPFVKKHRPTIGFSLREASLAERVTVVGSQQTFPEEDLQQLRNMGCEVERISGDGMSIATQLAER